MSPHVLRPAIRDRVHLMLALAGPSGSGKTYSALRLAVGLAGVGRIAFMDTETGRAKMYVPTFSFDHMDLEPPVHAGQLPRRHQGLRRVEGAGHRDRLHVARVERRRRALRLARRPGRGARAAHAQEQPKRRRVAALRSLQRPELAGTEARPQTDDATPARRARAPDLLPARRRKDPLHEGLQRRAQARGDQDRARRLGADLREEFHVRDDRELSPVARRARRAEGDQAPGAARAVLRSHAADHRAVRRAAGALGCWRRRWGATRRWTRTARPEPTGPPLAPPAQENVAPGATTLFAPGAPDPPSYKVDDAVAMVAKMHGGRARGVDLEAAFAPGARTPSALALYAKNHWDEYRQAFDTLHREFLVWKDQH